MDFKNSVKSSMKPMIEDIAALCRINSVEGEEKPGMPFGEGVAEALGLSLEDALTAEDPAHPEWD